MKMVRQSAKMVLFVVLVAGSAARGAELSVANINLVPGGSGTVVVSGDIAGESTFGVTILVEIVPQAGSTGAVMFTLAPPSDIVKSGDPWSGSGTFTDFDTDGTGSALLNGSVLDDGSFLAAPVTFTGELSDFPVFAGSDASGTFDVVLSTASGDSTWEGLVTTLVAGTITVSPPTSLTVAGLELSPGGSGSVVVSGEISGDSTFGVTILVELVPRAGATGTVTFTPSPPVDVVQLLDPWSGAGTFTPFDTDGTASLLLNGSVSDNGTFIPGPLTFSGALAAYPVEADTNADGTWDVVLSTVSGDSGWEGVATVLTGDTVIVTRSATLTVNNPVIPPDATGLVIVSGTIGGDSTFGVNVLLELIPRAGTTGTLTFTPAPPVDVTERGDPWPGIGNFDAFDTDLTSSTALNGIVSDNGTFLPGPVTFSDELAGFPVIASADATGVWDVSLTTTSGTSDWEGIPTSLFDGTVSIVPGACLVDLDCDDFNGCTDDTCNNGTCEYTDNTLACDDGDACTTADTCSAGACIGGAPPNCDDSNVCTDDSCDSATGCVNTNNTAPCDDGDACTTPDTCSSGACVGGPPPNCDDGNVCTDDSCDSATGCVNANNTVACDNGDACTTADACSGGACVGGGPTDCDDGNVCTDDSCDSATGCVNTNNVVSCDDGNACTTGDTCAAGACIGGAAPNCDDSNVCTDDSCDALLGCLNLGNTLACDDGLFCTTSSICSGGVCVGSGDPCPGQQCDEVNSVCSDCLVDIDCDDANVCTDNTCSGGVCSSVNNVAACDDGLFCTLTDVCGAGACSGSGDSCPGQVCDETGDVCVGCLVDTDCDDLNVCTDDTCVANVCQFANNVAACDDGLFCTLTDTCSGGVCVGVGDPCTLQFCDETLTACVDCLIDFDCDDIVFCNGAEICTTGLCGPGTDPCPGQVCDETGSLCAECLIDTDCNDGNVCTDETCVSNLCVPTANSLPCDDGFFCTLADQCINSSCVGSGDPCPGQMCDELGSVCVNCLANVDCDDGVFCNGAEQCVAGLCEVGADPCPALVCDEIGLTCVDCLIDLDCDDVNECTSEICNAGVCEFTNVAGACSDNSRCSLNDVCIAGVCTGTPKDCSALDDVCVAGVCHSVSGDCVTTPANESGACDDGLACTTGDVCSNGGCAGTFLTNPIVNLELAPASNVVVVGDLIEVSLMALSGTCADHEVGSIDSIIGWDPLFLSLEGRIDNGPFRWVISSFPNDSSLDGLNAPFDGTLSNDGDALYQAFAGFSSGPLVDATGLIVTTFVFRAIDGVPSTSILIPASAGLFTNSKVLGAGDLAGANLTGSLTGVTLQVVECITAIDCDDANPCTDEICDVNQLCSNVIDDTNDPDDGSFCNGVDTCVNGSIVVGTPPNCNDTNVCTDDSCDEALRQCVNANNDTNSPSDNIFCNGLETCVAGVIVPGTPPDCDDGNVCTDDSCNEFASQCDNLPDNTNDPDDGLFCNGVDTCVNGLVVVGDPPNCDDGNVCTDDFCQEANNSCISLVDNTNNPDDGQFCNGAEVCNNGVIEIVPGSVPDCDDANVCTDDSCDELNDVCVNANNTAPCDDGVFCTATDVCNAGACGGIGDRCPGLMCDETLDQCVNCLVDNDCDDTNVCTNDSCVGGACDHTDNTIPCDDALFCTSSSACSGGVCIGSGDACPGQACDEVGNACVDCLSDPDCNDFNICTDDTCVGGACVITNNSAPCVDGLFCTATDACSAGACVGSGDPCSTSLCDESLDQCVECLVDADCNDGMACTADTCVGGSCVFTPDDAFCDDGVFCNGQEFCDTIAGCVSPGNPCGTVDQCDELNDACSCEAPTVVAEGPRYLAVVPAPLQLPVAIRVTGDAADVVVSCVVLYVQADGRLGPSPVFRTPQDWGTVHISDREIRPDTSYFIETDCRLPEELPNFSPAVTARTWLYGDVDNSEIVDFNDISLVVAVFQGDTSTATLWNTDLAGCDPNRDIDFGDISAAVEGFQSIPFGCTEPCP